MFCKQSRVKWCKMIVRKVPCQPWIGFYSTPFRVSSKSPTWTSTEVFWRSRLMLTPSFPMIIERRRPSSTCNILEAQAQHVWAESIIGEEGWLDVAGFEEPSLSCDPHPGLRRLSFCTCIHWALFQIQRSKQFTRSGLQLLWKNGWQQIFQCFLHLFPP